MGIIKDKKETPLIDGKTGLPVKFSKRDLYIHSYSGVENPILRIAYAIERLEYGIGEDEFDWTTIIFGP